MQGGGHRANFEKSAAAGAPYCMPFAFSMASSMVPTM
jgi:hypothetical protein